MTDRELLERAAKAAGHNWLSYAEKGELSPSHWGYVTFMCGSRASFWNPLEDDGDAFRLAVKRRMHMDCDANGVTIHWWPSPKAMYTESVYESFGDDPAAATRRAIVRAAAAESPQKIPQSDDPPLISIPASGTT